MGSSDDILNAIAGHVPGPKGWIRANCPNCLLAYGKEDRTQALGLNTRTGGWHCFRCGESGRVPPHELPFDTSEIVDEELAETMEPPPGFLRLDEEPAASAMSTYPHRLYLLQRGIPRTTARAANIGVYLGSRRWSSRVIVPVLRPDGAWYGWVGRDISGTDRLRYRYPTDMDRGSILFNEAALEVKTEEPVLLVEGVFDALPYWPDCAAFLGKPSSGQLSKLLAARRPLVVALDGDAWTIGEALGWRLKLEGMRAASLHLPPGRDPGDSDPAELREQARRAVA